MIVTKTDGKTKDDNREYVRHHDEAKDKDSSSEAIATPLGKANT